MPEHLRVYKVEQIFFFEFRNQKQLHLSKVMKLDATKKVQVDTQTQPAWYTHIRRPRHQAQKTNPKEKECESKSVMQR